MRKTTTVLTRIGSVGVLTIFAIACLYPFVFIFLSSFKTSVEYTLSPAAWPHSFGYVQNFVAMFKSFDVLRLFFNTVIYIAMASIISLTATIPASFALAKLRFPLRHSFFMFMVMTLVIPTITFILPDYLLMSDIFGISLIDNPWSVILLWAATSIPGSVFLLASLMRGLPSELLEVSKIDGANYFQTMLRIVLPISLPGIVTISIFNVTSWWNDLLIPLVFLHTDASKTLTVAVATIVGRYDIDYPLLLTGLFMASLPPVLIYLFLQSYIRRGLVIGAIK